MSKKPETKGRIALKALEDDGTGLARFATLNVVDHDGDVTEPGAFGEQHVKLVAAHNYLTVPLGKARIFESGDEALAEFKFNLETESGREWHSALKFDLSADGPPLQEWSYGFTILESAKETRDGDQIRVLRKLKVHEVSPVVIGAGIGTATLRVKRAPLPFAAQIDETIDQVLDVAGRAKEIVELRAEQGRTLAPERVAQITKLKSAIDDMAQISDALAPLITGDEIDPAEAGRLLAQFELIRSRRHLSDV